ncbi:hypothetical protein AAP_00524 [Ascosphaera apis ARSEF 7405]|uniref:Uncharacterized protein n=1 Tax=Ascosphaera apis ARSEF 7405 TaxID=392613 RepID=A0A168CQ63_9EURO|nr:hypothetical protein AAP_00524 [Ascosphaera apis ARSEF 7405]
MMIPVDKIGRLSRQVMERTWPSSQPPRPIDWLNLEYDPFATKPRISAIVAHLGGDVAPEKCTECDAGKIFHTCRINPVWLSQKGACTSCSFHGKAKSCSFHPEFVEKAGSRVQPKTSRRTPRKPALIPEIEQGSMPPPPRLNLSTVQQVRSTPKQPAPPSKTKTAPSNTDKNTTPSRPSRLGAKGSSYGQPLAHQYSEDDDEDDGLFFDRGDVDMALNDEPDLPASGYEAEHDPPYSSIRRDHRDVATPATNSRPRHTIETRDEQHRARESIRVELPRTLTHPTVYTNFAQPPVERPAQYIDVHLTDPMFEYRHAVRPGMTMLEYREMMERKINEELAAMEQGETRVEDYARRTFADTPLFQARSMALGSRLGQAPYINKQEILRLTELPPEEEINGSQESSCSSRLPFVSCFASRIEQAEQCGSEEDQAMCDELELEESLLESDDDEHDKVDDIKGKQPAQDHGEFANAELHAPEGDGEVIDIIIDDSIGVTNEQDAANNAQDVNVEESSGIFDRIFNEAQGPWNETSRERGSVVDQDVTKAVERAQESTNASASEVVRDGNAHE